MRTKMVLTLSFATAAAVVVASIAAVGLPRLDQKPAPENANTSKPSKTVGPILLTLSTDKKEYAVGDPIKVTLTAENKTTAPIPITFRSGQRFDLELFRDKPADKNPVWKWSHGRMFAMMIMTASLAVDKPFIFTETIDPAKTPTAKSINKGPYHLEAYLTPSDAQYARAVLTATVELKVK